MSLCSADEQPSKGKHVKYVMFMVPCVAFPILIFLKPQKTALALSVSP